MACTWVRLLRLAACLALALPLWAQAMTGIIYQPQLRDMEVPAERWPAIFAAVRAQGIDTLVVQWGRYGDAFADKASFAWLVLRVQEARAAGLNIVAGLSADPDFFERQQQPGNVLGGYFRRMADDNRTLAQRWIAAIGKDAIAGWYLPIEIDDKRWRDDSAADVVALHLAREVGFLRTLGERPVYVTSFFVGNMAPDRYAGLLARLSATGVNLWVQDGAGVGRLRPSERALYLDAIAHRNAASGTVFEIFRSTGDASAFRAEPLPPAEAAAILARRTDGKDSVFFSLRYLPAIGGALPY
ncbi:DUF4434 domain-containing protein [Uliginosibacterium sp. sgz301328]|uniref:DUF4434 domain-containing protein n=1 Tax=Uliginosibacterium sp. sgz301328 TaxID=3243764 RepID=UPI00359E3296